MRNFASFPSDVLRAMPSGWIACSAIFFSVSPWNNASQASDLDPVTVLKRYEATLSRLDKSEYQAVQKFYSIEQDTSFPRLIQENDWQVRRDGPRWKLNSNSTHHSLVDGKPVSTHENYVLVFDDERKITVYPAQDGVGVDSVVAYRNATDAVRDEIYIHGTFMLVYGHIQGNGNLSYIPDILRKSHLVSYEEQLDGEDMLLLKGTGSYGEIKLWIDPRHDDLPRRLDILKRDGDILGKKTVAEYSGMLETSISFDIPEYQIVNEKLFIKSIIMNWNAVYENKIESERAVVEISNINDDPDFSDSSSFSVASLIPNGTEVQVNDAMDISFEWMDGEIVKIIPKSTLARLEGNSFADGPISTNVLLIQLNFVLVAVILFFFYLRRKNTAP